MQSLNSHIYCLCNYLVTSFSFILSLGRVFFFFQFVSSGIISICCIQFLLYTNPCISILDLPSMILEEGYTRRRSIFLEQWHAHTLQVGFWVQLGVTKLRIRDNESLFNGQSILFCYVQFFNCLTCVSTMSVNTLRFFCICQLWANALGSPIAGVSREVSPQGRSKD